MNLAENDKAYRLQKVTEDCLQLQSEVMILGKERERFIIEREEFERQIEEFDRMEKEYAMVAREREEMAEEVRGLRG